jgi:hypothetical protein
VVCYINNVLIATKETKEQFHEYIGKILKVPQNHELVVEIDKCNFNQKDVEFLSLLVSGQGLKMVPSEYKAITK